MARQNFPATIEEMIRQNLPQISLHITSFSDFTLVALTWPHIMMDAIGQQALLHGWSLVLAGEEERSHHFWAREKTFFGRQKAQPNMEGRESLCSNGNVRRESVAHANIPIFVGQIESSQGYRLVFLPRNAFERLQRRIKGEVAETAQSGGEIPFVSEGDILTAWVTRVVASLSQRHVR